MKKNLFILAAAAIAFTACSSDETIAVNEGLADANTISFRALNDGMTRSGNEKLSFANNDEISVRAKFGSTNYFAAIFKYASSTFSPSTTTDHYYWPAGIADEDGKRMVFYATYPAATASQTGDGQFSLTDFAGTTDILYAQTAPITEKPSDGAQTLNFRHALSEIDVKVKNSNTGLQFSITGVKVGYVAKSGSFSCNAATTTNIASATGTSIPNLEKTVWTRIVPTNPYEFEYVQESLTATEVAYNDATAKAITGLTPWMLIPQNLSTGQSAPDPVYATTYIDNSTSVTNVNLKCAYIALKMAIKNHDTNNTVIVAEQWCYWPITTDWEPGKKYTYIIDAAGGGYQPKNQGPDSTTDLDPVLAGLEITFNPANIDVWVTDINENGNNDDDIYVGMLH